MAPHSSTLAWKIPWAEEPGRLQSMGSLRVRHDWATSLSLFPCMHWRRKWPPTPVLLPGESQGQGSLVGCRLWGRILSNTTEVTSSSSSSVLVAQWCPTLCDPVDYRPPGSNVHGILQARILEWVAVLFSGGGGGLPDPGIKPTFPALQADSLPSETPRKSPNMYHTWRI